MHHVIESFNVFSLKICLTVYSNVEPCFWEVHVFIREINESSC